MVIKASGLGVEYSVTAFRKIALTMLGIFMVVYVAGAMFYIHQARRDIIRELEAAATLAQNLEAPARLPAPVVAGLRHLRPVADVHSGGQAGVPVWFSRTIGRGVPVMELNGWRLDPADEIGEIWESFVLISLAYVTGMALCFLALFRMVSRGMRPLQALSEAMAAVADGSLTSRLPGQEVKELDALATRFNDMAAALEQERQTVSRLMTELLRLQDRERERIARVLHDDLGQYLTGIRAQARSWVYDPQLSERQKQQAQDLARHCETLQRHFRHLLQDLHPLVMEQLGLAAAVRHLAEQWQQLSGLQCELVIEGPLPEMSGEQQTHLYRFLQEALNNVSRHAGASRASLRMSRCDGQLLMEVRDDGIGSENLMARAGLGLRSMCERARCLGGEARFVSGAGQGTRVCLSVPLPASGLVAGGKS